MKIVVFGSDRRVGAITGQQVIDLNYACAKRLKEQQGENRPQAMADAIVPADLLGFIEGDARALDEAQTAIAYVNGQGAEVDPGIVYQLGAVKLLAPRPSPASRIACAGGNYVAHSAGMITSRTGGQMTLKEAYDEARASGMWGFWKVGNVVGTQDDVVYPARTQRLDYEGEAAIVLGKRGRDVTQSKASDMVWGVTLLVDWSTRDGGEQARGMSFNLAKNFDTSTTLGPCIVVGELDPQNVDVSTVVNGQERQHFNTKDMTFSFAEYLEYLSRDFTFLPGDILSGGTGAGTAMESARQDGGQKFLKIGDVVDVSSPQVGAVTNRIVAKTS